MITDGGCNDARGVRVDGVDLRNRGVAGHRGDHSCNSVDRCCTDGCRDIRCATRERSDGARVYIDGCFAIEGVESACINGGIIHRDAVGVAGPRQTAQGGDGSFADRGRHRTRGLGINAVGLRNRCIAAVHVDGNSRASIDRGGVDRGVDRRGGTGERSDRARVHIDGCFAIEGVESRCINRRVVHRDGVGVACPRQAAEGGDGSFRNGGGDRPSGAAIQAVGICHARAAAQRDRFIA